LIERHARAVCDLFVQTWNARQGERVTLSLAASRQLLEPELENARAAFAWAVLQSLGITPSGPPPNP
jgi:hypothetical protein